MTVEGALHAWIDADLNVQIEDEAYWASFGKIAAEANSAAGRRDAWLDACVAEVRACIAEGIAVHSYLYWSLLDNFEWTQGYSQRFGLVAVDRATFRRTAKPSAAHFAGIIQTAKTCSS